MRTIATPPVLRLGGARATAAVLLAVVLGGALTGCNAADGADPAATTSSSSSSSSPQPSASPTTGAPDPGSSSTPDEPGAPTPSSPPSGEATVTIITLEAMGDVIQASGILPGVVESDGECMLTVYRGDEAFTGSAPATPSRDSTYCGLVNVSTAGMASGTWDAVLSYRSAASSATSVPAQVTVP